MGTEIDLGMLVRLYGEDYQESRGGWLPDPVERAFRAISQCRTSALGGHVWVCEECGAVQPRYNSCRNRHCPQCQGLARHQWLQSRLEDVLPVPYFHAVFTLPSEIYAVARGDPKSVYNFLFKAAWGALRSLACDPRYLGAEVGMLAVLHSWGQQVQLHPHLHCVVPGVGLAKDGVWRRVSGRFLVPVRALSAGFRGRFLALLDRGVKQGEVHLPTDLAENPSAYVTWLESLRTRRWVVYLKDPFAGPEHILRYLALYTHRVAISDRRLIGLADDRVTYRYKDYRSGGDWKTGEMHAVEFLRRFAQHILPRGFVRIRYYGILSNRRRKEAVASCRSQLGEPDLTIPKESDAESAESSEPMDFRPVCSVCGKRSLRQLDEVRGSLETRSRAPPRELGM